MKYCLDTNIFIEAWSKYYHMDFCSDYWRCLDEYAQQGIIFAPEEVKLEIDRIDDNLREWLSPREHFFRPITDDVQECLAKVFEEERHHRLVDSIRGRSKADPWVIAHALAESAVVVTKEEYAPPNSPRVKIPNVCEALGVDWIDDYGLIRRLGLTFKVEAGHS
ncbi:MAG TPA: DUF4411 family protein [Phycisphaerales bacterium]|nr:DUF4411 family protein [Phycisphaerales bacterium]